LRSVASVIGSFIGDPGEYNCGAVVTDTPLVVVEFSFAWELIPPVHNQIPVVEDGLNTACHITIITVLDDL
jgi:hypothetical protein